MLVAYLLPLCLLGNIACVCAQSVRLGVSEFVQQPPSHRELNTEALGQIENFYLINTDTERRIRLLRNGDVINISNRATFNYSIEALTINGSVGSVQFGYQGSPNFHTENYPPYALCGNHEDNYYACGALAIGEHTVTATPFLDSNAEGQVGKTLLITFTVADSAPTPVVKAPTRALIGQSTLAPKSCTLPRFTQLLWQSLRPKYPLRTHEPQGLLIGNDFIQFSGYTEIVSDATNHTYAKDVTVRHSPWRRMDDVPVAWGITHVPTVAVDKKVYLCGGYYGAAGGLHIANCFVYDHSKAPGSGQWSRLPDLPHGGSGGGGMIYDKQRNALYYSGGAQRFTLGSVVATDVNNTYRYSFDDPGAGWVETSPLPYHGNHLSYVTHTDVNGQQRHFFLGGQEAEFECCRNLVHNYEFVAETETWVRRAPMPMPRGHASASTRPIGCGFIIAGGSTNSKYGFWERPRTSDVSYYDLPTDKWTSIGTLPFPVATPLVDIHSNGYMYFSNDRMSRRRIA